MRRRLVPALFATAHLITALTLCVPLTANAESGAAETSNRITIAVTGDVYIDAPTRNTLKALSASVGRAQAYKQLVSEVAPALRSATLSIVNLETPTSPRYRERRPGEPPIFAAHEELLDALVYAGVDAITLANNHAYDQGIRGLGETLANAKSRRLPTVGVGDTADSACGPLFLSTPLGEVGLCTWTESLNLRAHDAPDPTNPNDRRPMIHVAMTRDDTIRSCLTKARERAALAVAAFHFTPTALPDDWRGPGAREKAMVKAAVDAGAELVIGHGPHVPGWVERQTTSDGRQVLIIYSLGNLVGAMGQENKQRRRPRATVRDAPVVSISFTKNGSGRFVAGDIEVTPYWIADATRRAPWWAEEGGQPLTRPLSIQSELRRLAAAKCGPRCEHHERSYRLRAKRLAAALGVEIPLPTAFELEGMEPPNGAVAAIEEEEPATEEEPIAEEEPATEEEPVAEAPAEPALPPGSTAPPSSTASTLDALARGVVLPVSFTHNRVAPEVTDDAELRRLAQLLNQHREVRVEISGTAVDGEDLLQPEQFGFRRARAVMWILSGYGPSRARFEVIGAPQAGEARVMLRVIR